MIGSDFCPRPSARDCKRNKNEEMRKYPYPPLRRSLEIPTKVSKAGFFKASI